LGVTSVELRDKLTKNYAARPEDLKQLASAKRIKILQGIEIELDGERVVSLRLPPSSELRKRFGGVRTRQELLDSIARFMRDNDCHPATHAWELTGEPTWAALDGSDEMTDRLRSSSKWAATIEKESGLSALTLAISGGHLIDICVSTAPSDSGT
jgi:hypothetical protein